MVPLDEQRRGAAGGWNRHRLHPAVGSGADEVRPAVTVDVRESELHGTRETGRPRHGRRCPRAGRGAQPSGDAVGAAGVDLDVTVRVEIARDGGDDRRACGGPESRVAVIPPRSIVHERDVRRRLLDQDDVRVAVGVEIGDDEAGRWARVGEADPRSERTERAVAVVVQELVPAAAFDQQQVEVAIVIGVEQRAVDGRAAAAVGVGGRGDVRPLTLRRLAPELVGAAHDTDTRR